MPPDDPTAVADRAVDYRLGDTPSAFPENPRSEPVAVLLTGRFAEIGGCSSSHLAGIGDDIARLDAMTSLYTVPGMDSTPCVFEGARAIMSRLGAIIHDDPGRLLRFLERLIGMRQEIERRTQGPYRLSFDLRPREPLPREVLTTWPFQHYDLWVEDVRALRQRRAIVTDGVPIEERDRITGERDDTLAEELAALGDSIDASLAAARTPRRLPQVEAALAALRVHTPAGIARQTGRSLRGEHLGEPLIDHIGIIMYHGVYTVLLDRQGRPLDIPGLFAPIVVADPGRTLVRRLPPPGTYISIAKYSSGPYRIDGPRVQKVIGGSIGKLTRRILHVEATHELQERIQQYVDKLPHTYAAAIVGPFKRRDFSAGNLKDGLIGIAGDAIPHMRREVVALAKNTYENWDEVAAELGEAFIREAIVFTAKEVAVKIIVKRLGVKLVPVIGTASTIWDLFDDEGTRRDRHLIACVQMYTQGTTADDRELAAMVIAKILVSMARDTLMDAITGAAVRGGRSLTRRPRRTDPGLRPRKDRVGDGVPAPAHRPAITGGPAPGHGADVRPAPQDGVLRRAEGTAGDQSHAMTASRGVRELLTGDRAGSAAPLRRHAVDAQQERQGLSTAGDRAPRDPGAAGDVGPAVGRRATDERRTGAVGDDSRERSTTKREKRDKHAHREGNAAKLLANRNDRRPRAGDEAGPGPEDTDGKGSGRRRRTATSAGPEPTAKGTMPTRRRPAVTQDEPETAKKGGRKRPSLARVQTSRRRPDPWGKQADKRGREIEDAVGEDDYPGYISTDDLTHATDPAKTPFKRGRNFPEIDFVSPDGTRTVSVKSVDTHSSSFTSDEWYYTSSKQKGSMADGIIGHAESLLLAAPSDEIVLDIRVPPDTPDDQMRAIEDAITYSVNNDSGRLTVIVKRYP